MIDITKWLARLEHPLSVHDTIQKVKRQIDRLYRYTQQESKLGRW